MNNNHLHAHLKESYNRHIAYVREMDKAGLNFANMIKELQERFGISFTEAKTVLMLIFPNYS